MNYANESLPLEIQRLMCQSGINSIIATDTMQQNRRVHCLSIIRLNVCGYCYVYFVYRKIYDLRQ